VNHLKTLPITGERRFDGGDRWVPGGDDPETITFGSVETFEGWRNDVLSRKHPPRYMWAPPGSRLSSLKIGAGSLVVAGAPPATGKTALMLQVGFDALRSLGQEDMRLLIANVEMSPQSLLDRVLARLSGVGYGHIQERSYDEDARPRLVAAMEEMRDLMPRVDFLRPPFTLENLAERATAFDAGLVIVDYIQRFTPSKGPERERLCVRRCRYRSRWRRRWRFGAH
jgi:replicative DNA helicase